MDSEVAVTDSGCTVVILVIMSCLFSTQKFVSLPSPVIAAFSFVAFDKRKCIRKREKGREYVK